MQLASSRSYQEIQGQISKVKVNLNHKMADWQLLLGNHAMHNTNQLLNILTRL
jgi:hypothetical protein